MAVNNIDKITSREVSDELMNKIDFLGTTKTSKEYYVNTPVGTWEKGQIIPEGTLVSDIIEGILDPSFELLYTSPEFRFDTTDSYETGSTFSPVVIPTFIQNDGGEVTSYKLFREVDGIEKQVVDSLVINGYIEEGIETNKVGTLVKYRAVVSYAEGEYKYDENDQPIEGKILAGELETAIEIICYRAGFYEASPSATKPVSTSDEIRALTNKVDHNITIGDKIPLLIPAGSTRVTFAYPATIGNGCKIVSDVLGYDVSGAFTIQQIEVAGANELNSTIYNVYTYIPAVPFPTEDTYILIIK